MLQKNELPTVLIRVFFERCEDIKNRHLVPFLTKQKTGKETLCIKEIYGVKTIKSLK